MSLALLSLLLLALQAPALFSVSGTVTDVTGASVADAVVVVETAAGGVGPTRTLASGTFQVQTASPPLRLRVSKEGFADRVLQLGKETSGVEVRLELAALSETTRAYPDRPTRIATLASATTIQTEDISRSSSLMVDDQLRAIPGFSLFRRSSSRVANPTTQGVTMRGLAASGASRSIVKANDLPLNDPFGGWVYWNRIPIAAVERIGVVRGGAGDLHGSDAMGGAIDIVTDNHAGGRVWIDGGSHGAVRVSSYGGIQHRNVAANGSIEGSTSDGFVVVAPEERGPIDSPASQRYFSAHGEAIYVARHAVLQSQGNYFAEERGNGTPFQTNGTIVRQFAASVGGLQRHAWTARLSGASQDYDQTFSAIAADRASERPTTIQHVDTGSLEASGDWLWSGVLGGLRTAGSFRQVRGDLFETPALGNGPTALTEVTQRTTGVWTQATFRPNHRLTVDGGVRLEHWRSDLRDGGAGRSATRVLPRASVSWQFAASSSLRATAQHSHRTPTINELHRGFRVGNVVTQPNARLEPEKVTGGEVSLFVHAARSTFRTIGFWTRLDDAIVNVTLESGPALILRQRQNAGRIRAAGVEFEVDARLASTLTLLASAAYVDSVFTDGVALNGLRVPQVPRWQTSVGAHGAWHQLAYSIDWRFIGSQYDDDRNEFELDPSRMVNARVGWRVRRQLEVFAAIENVLDEEQDVGRTPVRTIGLPRTSRVGVRWNW